MNHEHVSVGPHSNNKTSYYFHGWGLNIKMRLKTNINVMVGKICIFNGWKYDWKRPGVV